MIALPTVTNGFRLRISKTEETIEFTDNVGVVPNRGAKDAEIKVEGLTYLQEVTEITDKNARNPIHIEPGFWLLVPGGVDPALGNTIVRLATIPHGDSLVAQSSPGDFGKSPDGLPQIADINTLPTFTPTSGFLGLFPGNRFPLGYKDPYLNPIMPAGIAAKVLLNPNQLLKDTIARHAQQGDKIVETSFFKMSTAAPNGGQQQQQQQPLVSSHCFVILNLLLLCVCCRSGEHPLHLEERQRLQAGRGLLDREGQAGGRVSHRAAAVHPDGDHPVPGHRLASRIGGHAAKTRRETRLTLLTLQPSQRVIQPVSL